MRRASAVNAWGRMHNVILAFSTSWRFTSELELVCLSAWCKSLVAVLVNVNIAHVSTLWDQIPFYDGE